MRKDYIRRVLCGGLGALFLALPFVTHADITDDLRSIIQSLREIIETLQQAPGLNQTAAAGAVLGTSTASYSERFAALQAERATNWATKYVRNTFGYDNEWDVEFDGTDSAADNVPQHLIWDSVVDDDWATPYRFQFNTPTRGIMRVDRITNPGSYNKTGNIWIRDPYLSSGSGITIEARLKISRAPYYAYMQQDAFSIIYQDDAGSFGLHLSPDGAKAGATDPLLAYDWKTYSYDLSRDYNVIRIYKYPNDNYFYWYIEQLGPFYGKVDPEPAYRARWDGSYPSYPRILIGDNSNAPDRNAIYELDYIRYRRGPIPLNRTGAALARKSPPNLPLNETATTGPAWVSPSTEQQFNTMFPLPARWGTGTIQKTADGFLFDSAGNYAGAWSSNDYTTSLPGKISGGSLTLELKAKVLEGTGENGFIIEYFDKLGGAVFSLSKDKVTMLHGSDDRGQKSVMMDTTDRVHTYRLVRNCPAYNYGSCMYLQLYIDDDPIPAVVDRHLDATVLTGSRLGLGHLMGYPNATTSAAKVLVESIKWADQAYAPRIDSASTTASTLVANKTQFGPGETISATWNTSGATYAKDWVGLVISGGAWTDYTGSKSAMWFYTGGAKSGTSNVTAPPVGGTYQLVYFINDGYGELIRSVPLTVGGAPISQSCPAIDGVVLQSGQSRTFYSTRTTAYGCSNYQQSRTCTNGTLSGNSSYAYATCEDQAPCYLDGITLGHNQSYTFYSTQSTAYGCANYSLSRTCQNGRFNDGYDAYRYASCSDN